MVTGRNIWINGLIAIWKVRDKPQKDAKRNRNDGTDRKPGKNGVKDWSRSDLNKYVSQSSYESSYQHWDFQPKLQHFLGARRMLFFKPFRFCGLEPGLAPPHDLHRAGISPRLV